MAETIWLRGEGGAILAMDLPLPEGIDQRYAAGQLVRVNEDGSPYTGAPAREKADDTGTEAETGSDLTAGRPPRPPLNGTKDQWIAHVVGRGLLSSDDAANLTKADLIELTDETG